MRMQNGNDRLSRPRGRIRVLGLVGLLLVAAGALWWLSSLPPSAPTPGDAVAPAPAPGMTQNDAASDASGRSSESASPGDGTGDWVDALAALPLAERAAALEAWWREQQEVLEGPALGAELRALLASGADFSTGRLFQVGPGGQLESAPTFRVQLLDWWGAVDPAGAAAYAREIFATSAVPDEWALALRNYGRRVDDPSQDSYYNARIHELLSRPDWQAAPTRGFLEAFDAAVHSGAPALVADLLSLSLTAPHRATRRAGVMALDNLAGDDPLLVASVLNQPNSPIAERPNLRASLISRLDPRNEGHVAELRRYLLAISHGSEELAVFAETFPNANDFAAHYLLTQQPGRNLREMAEIDLVALRLIRVWKEDPAFAHRMDTLGTTESRLVEFLESALRGRLLKMEDLE